MSGVSGFEAVAGGLLVFFLPGMALTLATFPEWRYRGPGARLRIVTLVALAFVLSVVLTVLVGYALLNDGAGGFQANWSDPILEVILLAITALGLLVAALRGAFSSTPSPRPSPTEVSDDEEGAAGAWELMRELDRLGREERRLQHALRRTSSSAERSPELQHQLDTVREQRARLEAAREAEYAR